MKPTRSILDKRFVWTPSHQTDIRKRFEQVKKEQAEQRGEKRQVIQMRTR